MVFNATFNNISVISGRSVLLVEETGVTGENHRSDIQYGCYRADYFNKLCNSHIAIYLQCRTIISYWLKDEKYLILRNHFTI
jgi:hypothetical protein